ncbi:hypothetical protein B0J11DRAFT_617543 [Dendryphion nanum]|uniref:Uncharacterized protein n=1 Tax=Dendryphion nanum TaxID=256645 RepID=A0A9P9IF63_9PLEO|nr:hypothetical protein B0J11DRAFT_617543 [Dendryphion nanum]
MVPFDDAPNMTSQTAHLQTSNKSSLLSQYSAIHKSPASHPQAPPAALNFEVNILSDSTTSFEKSHSPSAFSDVEAISAFSSPPLTPPKSTGHALPSTPESHGRSASHSSNFWRSARTSVTTINSTGTQIHHRHVNNAAKNRTTECGLFNEEVSLSHSESPSRRSACESHYADPTTAKSVTSEPGTNDPEPMSPALKRSSGIVSEAGGYPPNRLSVVEHTEKMIQEIFTGELEVKKMKDVRPAMLGYVAGQYVTLLDYSKDVMQNASSQYTTKPGGCQTIETRENTGDRGGNKRAIKRNWLKHTGSGSQKLMLPHGLTSDDAISTVIAWMHKASKTQRNPKEMAIPRSLYVAITLSHTLRYFGWNLDTARIYPGIDQMITGGPSLQDIKKICSVINRDSRHTRRMIEILCEQTGIHLAGGNSTLEIADDDLLFIYMNSAWNTCVMPEDDDT